MGDPSDSAGYSDELPLLTTARLSLRLPRVEDAAAIVNFYTRNREFLAPFEPLRPSLFYTREFWETRALDFAGEFERDTSVRWVVSARDMPDRIIGTVGLTAIQRGPLQGANLGYAIDRECQGQGLMFEALTAAVEYAFDSHELHRIFAGYLPINERSARVLRRLGFEVIGYCRDYLCIAGKWQDHVLTSLINKNWTQR